MDLLANAVALRRPDGSMLDAYALKVLALRGRAYPVRLWGSVGFVIANFGAEFVIDRIAPTQIIWLLFGSFVIVSAVSLTLMPIAPGGGLAEKVAAASSGNHSVLRLLGARLACKGPPLAWQDRHAVDWDGE